MGIGPGSACTTRIQTGIGMPQLSCIMDSVNIAKENEILLLSDGGITCPGDCVKAYEWLILLHRGEFSDMIKIELYN